MKTKRAVSLIEVMIVIFLISLIAAAVGYNMMGSLDKGKEFKTKESQRQIRDILLLEVANGQNIDLVVANPRQFLERSGLVKDVDKILLDGWDEPFIITRKGEDIIVTSAKLEKIEDRREKKLKKIQDDFAF